MGWMDKCIGTRVGRAMADAGVGVDELSRRIGVPDVVLANRLSMPSSFTLEELLSISMALGCSVFELVPDHRCVTAVACDVCGSVMGIRESPATATRE